MAVPNLRIVAMKKLIAFAFLTPALPFLAQAVVSLEITGAQKEIVGTTSEVSGSGSSSNFGSASVNDFAVFDVAAGGSDYADLKITYASDDGSVGSNIMIAQTSNSQTLMDSATVSILIEIGNSGGGTVDLNFDWYIPGSFSGGVEQAGASLISAPINYTTFDIDFQQVVGIQEAETASYTLDSSTVLTATETAGEIRFEDPGANSTFTNPTTAVEFLMQDGTASHTISMGKQNSGGNALFMFEFRDPPLNVDFPDPVTTPVPEPAQTGGILGGLSLLVLALRRRRS